MALFASQTLARIPASFFGMVLGLAGLAGDWRIAHVAWSLPAAIGEAMYLVASITWLIIATLYALKWILAPGEAKAESVHAVQCCFIGLAGVATMLVAPGVLPYSRAAAVTLFMVGGTFTVVFALWRTGVLWRGNRDPVTTTPVLYLPMVAGGFVLGTVSALLGWREWAEFSFGAAFFTWLAIESVLLHRLYTAPALAPALRPTLGIQLAPPAVGAACYLAINGGHSDLFVHMLVGYALLQALLLARMSRWIAQQSFTASYLAFTFGATALAAAAIRLSMEAPEGPLEFLAPLLFLAANCLVLWFAARTIWLLGQLGGLAMSQRASGLQGMSRFSRSCRNRAKNAASVAW